MSLLMEGNAIKQDVIFEGNVKFKSPDDKDFLLSAEKGLKLGVFSSASPGSGIALTRAAVTAAMRIYADDGAADLYGTGSVPDLRGLISRMLITHDQTGGNTRLFGAQGQLKAAEAAFNDEMHAGLYGLFEWTKTGGTELTLGGTGITAAVMGMISTSESGANGLTVNTNHVLAGVASISKLGGVGALTQTGKTAAFYAGIYSTGWDAAVTPDKWKYGVYIDPASVSQAFSGGVSLASQDTENIAADLTMTTDSTYLTGDDITYSSARGSSALKIVSTFTGVGGGFSNIYSSITTSAAQSASGAGVIGIKGVVTNTGAMTEGQIYGAQFIAKHAHATNTMASEAALIGMEAIAYISAAGAAGTAIGANITMRNYGGAGTVHRGIQVVLDQAGGTKATEATGICVWNMAGSWDAVLRITGAFSVFADFDDASTCCVAVSNAPTNISAQLLIKTPAGATGYIPIYGTTGS